MRNALLFLLGIPFLLLSQPIEGDKSISIQGNGILWPDSLRNYNISMTNGYYFRDNIEVTLGVRYSYTQSSQNILVFPGVNYSYLLSDNLIIQPGLTVPYDIFNSILYASLDINIIYLISEMAGLKFTNSFEFESKNGNKTDKFYIGAVLYY